MAMRWGAATGLLSCVSTAVVVMAWVEMYARSRREPGHPVAAFVAAMATAAGGATVLFATALLAAIAAPVAVAAAIDGGALPMAAIGGGVGVLGAALFSRRRVPATVAAVADVIYDAAVVACRAVHDTAHRRLPRPPASGKRPARAHV